MEKERQIPIWFFIGALLAVYGLLIHANGLWDLFWPPEHRVALWDLHAGIWWGELLLILGLAYVARYWPWKHKPDKGGEN
jgi:hypothetical protein